MNSAVLCSLVRLLCFLALPAAIGLAQSKAGTGNTEGHAVPAATSVNFVSVSNGLGRIDKGSAAGIKIGDRFEVQRTVDTHLKTVSGSALMRHKVICTLTISTVQAESAAGDCVPVANEHGPESVPKAGDDVVLARN